MLVRRIFYGVLLAGMIVFHIFYQGAIAWYLFIITILMPLVSLLLTLPKKDTISITFEVPESLNIGDEAHAEIHVKGKSLLPIGCISFSFQHINQMTGRENAKKKLKIYGCQTSVVTFPIKTDECGRIKCELTKLKVHDYFGLFNHSYNNNNVLFINVFPIPKAPSPVPELPIGNLMGITAKPKPGGGFAEDYDVRNYRPGDPINLIHWKLTTKRDETMIREPLITERGKALITFNLFGTPAELARTFSILSWCVLWLLGYQVHPHIKWYDNNEKRERTVQITSHIELVSLLINLFSQRVPLNGQSVSGNTYEGFVWRYHISLPAYEETHPDEKGQNQR